jgi:two-component system cell cycle sensor histidine kinase/response regulator CckA
MLGAAFWALLYAVELNTPTLAGKVFWAKAEYLGIVSLPVAWFLFARRYAGASRKPPTRWLAALCLIPAATFVLAASNELHGLLWSRVSLDTSSSLDGLVLARGSWFWVHLAYSYGLLMIGSVMLGRAVYRQPQIYRQQAMALLLALVAPWIGNGLSIFVLLPHGVVDMTPFAFAITGAALAVATFRLRLARLLPAPLSLARSQIFEKMTDGVLVLDLEGRVVTCNEAARRMLVEEAPDLVGSLASEFLGDALVPIGQADLEGDLQFEVVLGEGPSHRHLDVVCSVLGSGGERGRGRLLVLRDVSERTRSEEALCESEERFRTLFEQGSVGIAVLDLDQRFVRMNSAFCGMLGYQQEELLGRSMLDVSGGKDLQRSEEQSRALLGGDMPLLNMDKQYSRNDGELIWGHVTASVLRGKDGQPVGSVAVVQDISERKRSEEALRTSQTQLEAAMDLANLVNWEFDVDSGIFTFNDRFYALYGTTAAAEGGYQMPADVYARNFVHPEDEHMVAEEIGRAISTPDPDYRAYLEHRIVRRDGEVRHIVVRYSITKDEHGRTIKSQGANQDITERKRIEEALVKTEDQLRQSQKMEAVGQLAGGIAHDFNNLLTAIIGNSELAIAAMDPADPNRELIATVKQVGERAAGLTKQILAFSRRQILRPEVICLNDTVAGIRPLLLRTLGEDIALDFRLASDLVWTEVDPHQMGQVLINLALNARDAMPEGGRLTIETANAMLDNVYCQRHPEAEVGRHAMLAVSDTGYGMDAATQSHIFEPFFTTKEVGKGTGLGLSTVFGIVQQSGGSISVYSELGKGSTFRVYLPAAKISPDREDRSEVEQKAQHGHETVLVVEDEPAVRELVSRILSEVGYRVLPAGSARGLDAALAEAARPPDLLLTDVVLPGGANGRDVADNLVLRYPSMKVLYMSGYTMSSVVHDGRLEDGIEFLEKPFTAEALLGKVRRVLDDGTARACHPVPSSLA